jgi:hypothetical protein
MRASAIFFILVSLTGCATKPAVDWRSLYMEKDAQYKELEDMLDTMAQELNETQAHYAALKEFHKGLQRVKNSVNPMGK